MSKYEAIIRVEVEADDLVGAVYDASDGLEEGFMHYDSIEASIVEVSEK